MTEDVEVRFVVRLEGTEEETNLFRAGCAKENLQITTVKHGLGLAMCSTVVTGKYMDGPGYGDAIAFIYASRFEHKVKLLREKALFPPSGLVRTSGDNYLELNVKVRAKCAGDLNYNADNWYISQNVDDEQEGDQLFVLTRRITNVSLSDFHLRIKDDLAGFSENIVPGQSMSPLLCFHDAYYSTGNYSPHHA